MMDGAAERRLPASRGDAPDLNASARGPIIAGIAVVIGFFGLFSTWAAVVPIAGAAIAPGQLKVEGKRQSLQHRDGGIVAELSVREGDVVRKGDRLIKLDDTTARAQLEALTATRDGLKATEARLIAERDGDTALAFDATLTDRATVQPAREAMANQLAVFHERRRQFDSEAAVLRQKTLQLSEQRRGDLAQIEGIERQLKLIREEIKGIRTLYDQGYAPKTRLLALERAAAALHAERGARLADVARAEQATGEVELSLAKLSQTRLTAIVDRLRETQAELAGLAPQLESAAEVLRRTELTAPASGTVIGLTAFTVGGVIQPGANVLDVVPSQQPFVVEAELRPGDVDEVRAGAPASVRLTSINRRDRPALVGTVAAVSADRIAGAQVGQDHYGLTIDLDPGSVAAAGLKLQSGMSAQVLVTTRPRSMLDYLVAPLRDEISNAFRER